MISAFTPSPVRKTTAAPTERRTWAMPTTMAKPSAAVIKIQPLLRLMNDGPGSGWCVVVVAVR